MKNLCFVVLLIAVTVVSYNGPADADAAQSMPAVKVEKLEQPVHVKLDRNVDILPWDVSAASIGGSLAKGVAVTVVGTVGGKAVVLARPGAHHAYLVAIDQLPEQVRSSMARPVAHAQPCPIDPQKRLCEARR